MPEKKVFINNREIRRILGAFRIKTENACLENGKIKETFSYESPFGLPYRFTVFHDGTALDVADSIEKYLTKERFIWTSAYDTNVVWQLTGALRSIRDAVYGKLVYTPGAYSA